MASAPTFTITLLAAAPLGAAPLAAVTATLAAHQVEVLATRTLSAADPAVVALDAHAVLPAATPPRAHARVLRAALLAAVPGVDVAVIPAAVAAPGPRLLVADMDSTLIQCECIDELAGAHGVGAEVADVTRRAMLGELDFEASLRARVARLAGLAAGALDDLAARLPVTPGAAALVRAIHADGGHAAVVSGGFTFATTALAARLGLDHAHANTLALADGRVTGALVGAIVGPVRKAELIDELAAVHGLPAARVLAVGDGANDLLMLDRAGLGVAFHAKPRVAAAADTALSGGGLERILYLLGWTRARIDALTSAP